MTTTIADPYISQPDWWITIGRETGGTPAQHGAKDATLTPDDVTVGLYHLVIGNGGIDSAHREIHVDASKNVAANTLGSVAVIDIDNTHKDIRFQDSVGAGVAPDQITVAVRRLSFA